MTNTPLPADAPLLIMGATSGIGACTVDEALTRGHAVRAFARSADEMTPRDGLSLCAGDATDPEDVARALEGAGAVIYALGIKERLAMLWEEETLFSETTRILLAQMDAAKVTRLIVVTGFGAGRSKSAMSFVERAGHRAILGKPYADKDRQEKLIEQSSTDWTIVRPVILTKGDRAEVRVLRTPSEWRNGLISRKSVARHLIDTLEGDLDIKSDVVIAR